MWIWACVLLSGRDLTPFIAHSYSYDSFCVPDDDEEVEMEATSSQ